ncbi:unnamed protein product [Caenorhabditis bovis]|uniref:Protein-serine/threonine phosphatase n=1 Tax=Caenorhabditis bovis TaxID=2654633 RepID=A0A8S1ELQ2_9PELO|nr:unnamed protein product [Caenorhabditis bovis]
MPSLQDLLSARKQLKTTEITKTLPNGEVIVEKKNAEGEYEEEKPETSKISNKRRKKVEYLKRCGFVIDLEPDLTIGKAMEGLTFGSQDVAADLDILKNEKITHILNVGTGIPNHFPNKFKYLKIDILDLPETQIADYFDDIFSWIDNARKENGIVFAHCNAGISRSATIVCAYLMKTLKLKAHEAMEQCRKTRDIRPNSGFMKQLVEYESKI